jgi:protein-S-isoprenylcysteine O-methyltransferase Ste14
MIAMIISSSTRLKARDVGYAAVLILVTPREAIRPPESLRMTADSTGWPAQTVSRLPIDRILTCPEKAVWPSDMEPGVQGTNDPIAATGIRQQGGDGAYRGGAAVDRDSLSRHSGLPEQLDFTRARTLMNTNATTSASVPDNGERGVPGDKPASPRGGVPRWVYLLCGAVFKTRGLLMVPPILVILFSRTWEWENDVANWAIGLPLFAAGFALRVWSQEHLHYRLPEGKGMAATGPYAYVRNPVYLANMALLASLCIPSEVYWMIPVVLIWAFTVYQLSIRFEEIRLAKRFGQPYLDYCASVPRWIPRVPRGEPGITVPAGLWRSLRVEWHCLFLLMVPVLKELVVDPHAMWFAQVWHIH